MPNAKTLKILLVQPDIIWEDIPNNLNKCDRLIADAGAAPDVILLPELFSTGFSMNTESCAESMAGRGVNWMRHCSRQYQCFIGGSLIIREGERCFNRFVWMDPEGKTRHYDKRHLFAMGGEDRHYSRGEASLRVRAGAFRIRPLICYDLRFPVWSRQRNDYDLLVYVANWPAVRQEVWNTLLKARALENQSYVIGLNRTGKDGAGIAYKGGTLVFSPKGGTMLQLENRECTGYIELSIGELQQFRRKFPVWRDADPFTLT